MDHASDHSPLAAAEDRACPVCASVGLVHMNYPSSTPRWTDLDVLICKKCGFGFVPKVDFDLDEYYARSYGESHGRRRLDPRFFKDIDANQTKKVKRSRWHAAMLNERFGAFDSVLDIGSGPGFFLHYVKAARKYAIESDHRSQDMLAAIGAKVVASLDAVRDLDLIVMSHVLEHFLVDSYRDYLRSALARLKPGGLLMIEVPEWPHLYRRSERPNGKGHDPHTMFFSSTGLLNAVEAELVYFHDRHGAYPVEHGEVDWDGIEPKECGASSMMAIWRRPAA